MILHQVSQLPIESLPNALKMLIEVVFELLGLPAPLVLLLVVLRELVSEVGPFAAEILDLGLARRQLIRYALEVHRQPLHVLPQVRDALSLYRLLELERLQHSLLFVLEIRLALGDQHVPLLQHLPQLAVLLLHQLPLTLEHLDDAGQLALQPVKQLLFTA